MGGTMNVYRPGSDADFDRLYRDSYGKIVGTLIGVLAGDRATAEDCAQEAFVRAYGAWSRWRPDAPAEAWVMRIAVNTAISHARRQKLREVGEVIRRLGRPQVDADPSEQVGPLLPAMSELKPADRALLILRHYHGYSNREIAVALNRPESTISARLVKARGRLRSKLEGEYPELASPPKPRVVSPQNPQFVNPGGQRVVSVRSAVRSDMK
jgi:RNA polymerase sigma-70 factor (ECF subfamily)